MLPHTQRWPRSLQNFDSHPCLTRLTSIAQLPPSRTLSALSALSDHAQIQLLSRQHPARPLQQLWLALPSPPETSRPATSGSERAMLSKQKTFGMLITTTFIPHFWFIGPGLNMHQLRQSQSRSLSFLTSSGIGGIIVRICRSLMQKPRDVFYTNILTPSAGDARLHRHELQQAKPSATSQLAMFDKLKQFSASLLSDGCSPPSSAHIDEATCSEAPQPQV